MGGDTMDEEKMAPLASKRGEKWKLNGSNCGIFMAVEGILDPY